MFSSKPSYYRLHNFLAAVIADSHGAAVVVHVVGADAGLLAVLDEDANNTPSLRTSGPVR